MVGNDSARGDDDDSVADENPVSFKTFELFLIGQSDVVADFDLLIDDGPFDQAIFADGKIARNGLHSRVGVAPHENGIADDGSPFDVGAEADDAMADFSRFNNAPFANDRVGNFCAVDF